MTEKVSKEEKIEFEENPYDPDNVKPEDIVRLFYVHDVPIIPVVSKKGILIGILKKEDLISELSDIERVEKLKIDDFVTRLARKVAFDDLLSYGKTREFIVVNIFGVIQEKWTRMQLFSAAENNKVTIEDAKKESEQQRDDQTLEWMIYMILEHIPRALYAVNKNNKTIFYNSHFEDMYIAQFDAEVNHEFVEKSLKDSKKNDLLSSKNREEHIFFNKPLNIYYEKIPLKNKKEKFGFLIFCINESEIVENEDIAKIKQKKSSLSEKLEEIEKEIISDQIDRISNLDEVAEILSISKKTLNSKIKKFKIEIED